MQDLIETTTTRINPHIDPSLHVWGWEVPVYLFLGGLVAGLLVLNGWVVLTRREERMPAVRRVVPLLGVPLLGLGLLALFLDLEYKAHVFRFYTTFQVTSPMSWGAWILLVVFATSGLAALAALARGWPALGARLRSLPAIPGLLAFAERRARGLAGINAGLGVALGIYTGVLLSAFASRPLWNSALLGPLFLASGLSAGVALAALLSRDGEERGSLVRLDLGLMGVEAAVLALWLVGLATGGQGGRAAAAALVGGPYAAVFWALVVVVGLVVPVLLEVMALKGRWRESLVAPALVLVGGLALRFVLVSAGQHIGFGG